MTSDSNFNIIRVAETDSTSKEIVRELGDEESRKLYLYAEPGVYAAYPNGSADDTHTQRAGAEAYARMTADALRKIGLI